MSTPLKLMAAKRYSTDTKVKYTSYNSDTESFQSFNNFLKNLDNKSNNYRIRDTLPIIKNQRDQKIEIGNKFQLGRQIKVKSLVILAVGVVIAILCMTWDLTVRTITDQECWQRFKNQNCQFESTNPDCIQLLSCISEENFEFKMANLLLLTIILMLVIRFKKEIAKVSTIVLEEWQKLICEQ